MAIRTFMFAKIHRATVTGANVNYVGSITIDAELLAASGILPYEKVQVVDVDNGERLETYAIAGAAGIPMSTHFYPEVGAHLMRVAESAHLLEWLDWSYPVLQRHYEIRDGQVQVPDVPGIGIEWDEKAVAASQA